MGNGMSLKQYKAWVYGIPAGSLIVIFTIISIVDATTDWFILKTILGIEGLHSKKSLANESNNNNVSACCFPRCDSKVSIIKKIEVSEAPHKSNPTPSPSPDEDGEAKQYLFIDLKAQKKSQILLLPCWIRFFSDLLSSGIFTVFIAIIFHSLILSHDNVAFNTKCPDYTADCFDWSNDAIGPFSCMKGENATFNVSTKVFWCVGWVYKDTTAKDTLDAVGTCGGLLGIVSSIVPLTYYLSRFKRCYAVSVLCFVLPAAVVGGVIALNIINSPSGLSFLGIVASAILITTLLIGWIWGVWDSFKPCRNGKIGKANSCTKNCDGCCSGCEQNCCCRCCALFCCNQYKNYPWQWLFCCYCYCCKKACCNNICGELDPENEILDRCICTKSIQTKKTTEATGKDRRN